MIASMTNPESAPVHTIADVLKHLIHLAGYHTEDLQRAHLATVDEWAAPKAEPEAVEPEPVEPEPVEPEPADAAKGKHADELAIASK